MTTNNTIFHVANGDDIAALKKNGLYRCQSLQTEGFIHCCDRQQLAGVVQRYYQGVDDLMLLLIDPEKLQHKMIRENTTGGSELFPHIYGPINGEAIKDTIGFNLNSSERLSIES